MDTLTGFQRDLLYIVAGSDHPSGQDVSDELEDYYEEEINYGRLYPNLDGLVDEGFLEKGELDGRTNYYEITEDGTDAIHTRREWEDHPSISNSQDDVTCGEMACGVMERTGTTSRRPTSRPPAATV